ncbi:MAG: autoinducer binding domain-containing protein [Caldimonas sp.]
MFTWNERDPVHAPASVLKRGFLDDEVLDVVAAKNSSELDASIQRFMRAAEFDRYGLLVIHDDFSGANSVAVLSTLHNTPAAFHEEWVENGGSDPVCQQAKRSTAPFIYGPETYAEAGAMTRWERQAQFGFAHGICSTFHLPGNLHITFGIDRIRPLPRERNELARLVARSHFFATFLQSTALAILSIEPSSTLVRRLSPREHECIQWAAEGKTAWETGMILSIAEGSVAKILASAIRKLDCASKPHAVVKALRLGLIH